MVSKEQIISIHTLNKLRKLYYEGSPDFYTVYGQESDKLSKEQKREIVEMFSSSTFSMDEDSALKKEDGGGGGGFGGDASAGTVFTSTNSGVFTPTYGRNSKQKNSQSSANYRTQVSRNKKKKKSGVERLGAWLRDYSPERKSISKGNPTEFAINLLADVSKEYWGNANTAKVKDPKLRNKVDTKLPENESVTNYRPKILDWKKKDNDNAGALTYAKALDTESSGEEGKIKQKQAGFRQATPFEQSQEVQCGSCIFFNEGDNECHVVTGHIEEHMWCNLYSSENTPKPEENQVVEGEDIQKARDLEDYFSNKYPMQSDKLKRRIIREAVFPRECASCKSSEWKGSVVPLELNHINGDHGDNAKRNLELICPNCHALTPHYRVKKPGSKSAIDLHGGAPKGDPRRDKSLDKDLRKEVGDETSVDSDQHIEKKLNVMTEEEREVGATQQIREVDSLTEKERDPKFIETDNSEDESDAVMEQNEFMERLSSTAAKHVGDKKDDSDEKASLMSAGAEFGHEVRLSKEFEDIYKENEDFKEVIDSLRKTE